MADVRGRGAGGSPRALSPRLPVSSGVGWGGEKQDAHGSARQAKAGQGSKAFPQLCACPLVVTGALLDWGARSGVWGWPGLNQIVCKWRLCIRGWVSRVWVQCKCLSIPPPKSAERHPSPDPAPLARLPCGHFNICLVWTPPQSLLLSVHLPAYLPLALTLREGVSIPGKNY